MRIGTASVYLDRLADNREAHWRLVHQGRGGGSPAQAPRCPDAPVPRRLPHRTVGRGRGTRRRGATALHHQRFPFFTWYFLYNRAIVAAGRGRTDEAFALADEIEPLGEAPRRGSAVLYAHHPRALAAPPRVTSTPRSATPLR